MVLDYRAVAIWLVVVGSIFYTYYEIPSWAEPYLVVSNIDNGKVICKRSSNSLVFNDGSSNSLVFNDAKSDACGFNIEDKNIDRIGLNILALSGLSATYLVAYHYIRDRSPEE